MIIAARSIRLALIIAFVPFLVAAAPALAQGRGGARAGDTFKENRVAAWRGDAEVGGKVTDEAGKGVAEARVVFILASANDGFFATTKKGGEFSAKDIKAGQWRVQVQAPNFVTWRQDVTLENKKNPLNIQLKRDNSPELLTRAEALFKDGKNAEARAEYLNVLAAHPELTAINRAIAFTYGRERNHVEALKYLDLALASNPNDSTLLQLAAASAMQLSDYPRAMGYLGKIEDATLENGEPLTDAAVNLINKNKSAEAITLLNRAIARFPSAPDAYFYRGFAKLQAGQNAEGKTDLEKYIELAPATAPQVAQARDLIAKVK